MVLQKDDLLIGRVLDVFDGTGSITDTSGLKICIQRLSSARSNTFLNYRHGQKREVCAQVSSQQPLL